MDQRRGLPRPRLFDGGWICGPGRVAVHAVTVSWKDGGPFVSVEGCFSGGVGRRFISPITAINVMSPTTIALDDETRDRLKQLGGKGETYDAIVRRLIDAYIEQRHEKLEEDRSAFDELGS